MTRCWRPKSGSRTVPGGRSDEGKYCTQLHRPPWISPALFAGFRKLGLMPLLKAGSDRDINLQPILLVKLDERMGGAESAGVCMPVQEVG